MLVYTANKKEFCDDVFNGVISEKIKEKFDKFLYINNNKSEIRSWENSMMFMNNVLNDSEIEDDISIAIEYQIPLTSKRVDFLIGGTDYNGKENIIIIELKQWEKAEKTSREGLVKTYLGGNNIVTTHPSYQAYTYTKIIENFNETIREEKIDLLPCAYLHNYKEEYADQILDVSYKDYIDEAPIFLKKDAKKLNEFKKKYIVKKDKKKIL